MKKRFEKARPSSSAPVAKEPFTLSKERLFLGLIVLLSLVLSGTYLYQLYSTGLIDLNFQDGLDSLTFHLRGISVSKGETEWLLAKQAIYTAIVGGLYAVLGVEPLWVFVFHVLLFATGCVLLYGLGKRIFSPAVGLLAAGLWAVYPVSIFYSGLMVRDLFIALLDLLLIYVFTLCLEKKNLGLYGLAAVISALAISGRYNIMLFIAVFFLWFLLFHLGYLKKLGSMKPWFYAGLALFLPLVGWLIWSHGHDVPQMVQWTSGNSYDSTGFFCQPTKGVIPILSVDFLLQQIYKTFLFFNTYEAPNNFHYDLFREKLSLLRYLPLSFGVVLPFAAVGFVAAFRNRKRIVPVVLFIVCYTVSVIPFFISSRHRFPVVPVLIMMMAYGVWEMVRSIRSREYKWLLVQAACLAVVALFATWQPHSMKQPQQEFIAINRLKFGNVYRAKGREQDAVEEFRRAAQVYPTYWPAYMNLGIVYEARGDHVQAVALYEKVLSLNPKHAEAYLGLGKGLARLGHLDRAVEGLNHAIDLKPQESTFYHTLGVILNIRKDYAGAAKAFSKTLALSPDFGPAHFNLGVIYLEQSQDRKSAAFHLRRFLQLSPNDPKRPAIEGLLREING